MLFFVVLFLAGAFFAGDFLAGAEVLAVVFLAGDFLVVDVFLAGAFFAVDFEAVDFAAEDFFAGAFFAVVLEAVDFEAEDFLAGAFLAGDFLAGAFFAVDFDAVDFEAVDFEAEDVAFFATSEATPAAFLAGAVAVLATSLAFGSFGSFFLPETTALRSAPAVNFGIAVFFALILSPVRGLRTKRASRIRFSKEPKPVMATFSPRATSRVMVSRTDSNACCACLRLPS